MRKFIVIVLVWLFSTQCFSQNFREWFRQKKTQKKYLEQQIAELKVYLELTEKGYKIAKQGLNIIGDIKKGEFTLHKNRFDSLRIVKPQIGSMSLLKEITDLHGNINRICEKLQSELAGTDCLDQSQLDYIASVLGLVYEDCQHVLTNLFLVIHSGNTSADDDQRIRRILLCHAQMQSNYIFTQSFQSQMWLLVSQIKREKTQIDISRQMHGIN
jgi:hypothetical protein